MKVQFLGIPGLAGTQTSELFGIAKDEFDLKAQFVESVDLIRRLVNVR